MGRPRRKKCEPREAQLRKRAASRHYTLEKDGDVWWAVIGGTRYGPMRNLDEVDEFLPKEP
jgi:hypothetical protein